MATATLMRDEDLYPSTPVAPAGAPYGDYAARLGLAVRDLRLAGPCAGGAGWAYATSSNAVIDRPLREFLDDINELKAEADDDDDDCSLDERACEHAVHLAVCTYLDLEARWFRPRLATDGGGGIRMTWERGTAEVRAILPRDASRPRYLYIELAGSHRTIPNFNPATLIMALREVSAQDHVK